MARANVEKPSGPPRGLLSGRFVRSLRKSLLLPQRLCLSAACLLAAAPAHAERMAAADEPPFIQTARQLAVKIVRGGGGPTVQFVGTGFAFVYQGKALAVTNYHVAALGLLPEPPAGGLHVGYAEPVSYHAANSVLAVPAADLAIIETEVVSPQAQPYPTGIAALGGTVYSVSFDQEAFQQASPLVFKGQVVGIVRALFPSSVLLVKPPAPPDAVKAYVIDGSDCVYGASGSMILNDSGELIAYNAGTIGNGLCIAVAIEEMVRALAR